MEHTIIKRTFLNHISPYFKAKGYTFITGPAPKYVLKMKHYYVICGFNFLTKQNRIYGGKVYLCLWDVENVILEIKYPNQEFEAHVKKDKEFLGTVGDLYGKFEPKNISLDTVEDIIDYAEAVKLYIETDGQKFIDHYSYLPNVLAEMDKLEKEGRYWKEILPGGPAYFFRGLIISKLCNDILFEQKLANIDKVFYSIQYELEEWCPYYDKLKERLKTLEPIYNV